MQPSSVAEWQRKLDSQFPHGLVASWDDGDRHSSTYLVPRAYVVDLQGRDPVVWLPVYAGSDKVLGPWRVVSYTSKFLRPFAAEVVFDDAPHHMLWNAGMDDKLRAAMAPIRSEGIRQFPDGGMEVIHSEGADVP